MLLGLLKDFALTAIIMILNHWIYGVEDEVSYGFIIDFISKNKNIIFSFSFILSITLVLSSAMFETLGLYRITYGVGKILIRISQFLITFIAILNIVFYAALGNNLMRDNGYMLLFSIAFVLGASVWAIRIIDFNYNSQNAVMPTGSLAVMSIILVEIVWPFYNF